MIGLLVLGYVAGFASAFAVACLEVWRARRDLARTRGHLDVARLTLRQLKAAQASPVRPLLEVVASTVNGARTAGREEI